MDSGLLDELDGPVIFSDFQLCMLFETGKLDHWIGNKFKRRLDLRLNQIRIDTDDDYHVAGTDEGLKVFEEADHLVCVQGLLPLILQHQRHKQIEVGQQKPENAVVTFVLEAALNFLNYLIP